MLKLSIDEYRMLAEVERMMDKGEIPYVVQNGQRLAFSKDVMEEFKVENGQTVSLELMIAMTEANIACLKIEIDLKKLIHGGSPHE